MIRLLVIIDTNNISQDKRVKKKVNLIINNGKYPFSVTKLVTFLIQGISVSYIIPRISVFSFIHYYRKSGMMNVVASLQDGPSALAS